MIFKELDAYIGLHQNKIDFRLAVTDFVTRSVRSIGLGLALAGSGQAWAGPPAVISRADAVHCVASAQRLIDELLPFAVRRAGRELAVGKPRTLSLVSLGDDSEPALARYIATTGEIDVFRGFCALSPSRQRVVIAHELGHAVDVARVGRRLVGTVQGDWTMRPGEIVASAHAVAIYRLAGLPFEELAEQLPARHLDAARQLADKE